MIQRPEGQQRKQDAPLSECDRYKAGRGTLGLLAVESGADEFPSEGLAHLVKHADASVQEQHEAPRRQRHGPAADGK